MGKYRTFNLPADVTLTALDQQGAVYISEWPQGTVKVTVDHNPKAVLTQPQWFAGDYVRVSAQLRDADCKLLCVNSLGHSRGPTDDPPPMPATDVVSPGGDPKQFFRSEESVPVAVSNAGGPPRGTHRQQSPGLPATSRTWSL